MKKLLKYEIGYMLYVMADIAIDAIDKNDPNFVKQKKSIQI